MPRNRPPTSGYARIAQAEEEEQDDPLYSDDDDPFQDPTILSSSAPSYGPIQPSSHGRMKIHDKGASLSKRPNRPRTNSGVDIKAINQRLEQWAEEIKDRFKIRKVKGKSAEDEQLEIYSSVFQPPDDLRPATREVLDNLYDDGPERLSKLEFDDFVESVRTAIELGMHPKLISQGSSGSYFARNSGGKIVGVFKPKDEEPYANKNPKWTKWIHRNLFPFAFGRACLIPNLSYVSEAAAYVLDCQLRTNIVPYTDVVSLSSRSFHYDYWERRAFRNKGKPLPEKPGSFQIFLKGFKGATEFFKEHPWPDQYTASTGEMPTKRQKRRWDNCRPGSTPAAEDSEGEDERDTSRSRDRSGIAFWSNALQQSFREQLEKLVILDYIMRNTDRGTDNWMIRIDTEKQEASFVMRPTKNQYQPAKRGEEYQRRMENMLTGQTTDGVEPESSDDDDSIPRIGAIDNSLSWPWKHPDAWRSYPFGWLFLPVTLIGRPFSEKTRKHFIPLLTSKIWWTETQVKLRQCFEMDADFKERMFARQMAVMKGQAWNVLETLKSADHGPLELTRRSRVLVWDDIVEVPVAVPLARPSAELRRATAAAAATVNVDPIMIRPVDEEDEMDIAAAARSIEPRQRQSVDLLNLSPTIKVNDNPFNFSRQSSTVDVHPSSTEAADLGMTASITLPVQHNPRTDRPTNPRARSGAARTSHQTTRLNAPTDATRKRGFSFAGMRQGEFGDEEDGDLGYAVANDLERSRRRVIVERLEIVKSRPPVFTWC